LKTKLPLSQADASGIGQATAKRLRDEGATVITAQRGIDPDFPSISVDFADPIATSAVVNQVFRCMVSWTF
jgi:meso-butanediol dehydrogenase/(S,S)-butanediol dehydrogenase/diacetyl reductase